MIYFARASNYNGYLNAIDQKGRPYLVADGSNDSENASRQQGIIDKIVHMTKLLSENRKKVVLFGAFHANEKLGARYLLRGLLYHPDARDRLRVDLTEFDRTTRLLNDRLRALKHPNIIFVDPHDIFCAGSDTDGVCNYMNGYPLLVDDGHFSTWGADKVAEAMRTALEAARRP